MLLSIILISLFCSIIMTQLGNLLTGQKSVSFKIIQGQITRTVFLTQAFRDLEFVILLTCIVGNVRFIICIYIYIYLL